MTRIASIRRACANVMIFFRSDRWFWLPEAVSFHMSLFKVDVLTTCQFLITSPMKAGKGYRFEPSLQQTQAAFEPG